MTNSGRKLTPHPEARSLVELSADRPDNHTRDPRESPNPEQAETATRQDTVVDASEGAYKTITSETPSLASGTALATLQAGTAPSKPAEPLVGERQLGDPSEGEPSQGDIPREAIARAQALARAIEVTAVPDATLIELWISTQRSFNTKKAYRREIKLFQAWLAVEGIRSLFEVDAKHALGYMADLRDRGLAAATRARAGSALKSVSKFGVATRHLLFDFTATLKLPRVPVQKADRSISADQVQKLLIRPAGARERAILALLYAGGLRPEELTDANQDDVTVHHIKGAASAEVAPEIGRIRVNGKGAKTRTILIPGWCLSALERYRATLKPVDLEAGEPLFRAQGPRAAGTGRYRLSVRQVERLVKDCAVKAGLPSSITPYTLRHSNANHALDGGADLRAVQQTLGHANLTTTSAYLHANPEDFTGMYLADPYKG